ncbi:MAG: hypothetical protein J6X70_02695 [Muribaculaceae bacterium]|nr:hypothetical protein [Muribaculaceae bacterium]
MKKSLLRLSMIVALLVSAFAWSGRAFAAVGDVNGDGVVSGADVTSLYSVLLDNVTVAGEADVNGDGVVSGADVTYLYRILLGEIPPVDAHLYILGSFVEGGWAPNKGIEMNTSDGIEFTYTVTPADTGDGYAYFSFTKKLAENDGDNGGWEEIAAERIGAVSEGDFWVTDEMLNTELSLQAGDVAFKIPANKEYTFTVNLEAMTLYIAGEVTPQPEKDLYIIGDVVEGGWAPNKGILMQGEDGIYIATLNITDVVYFGFTTKLAENDGDNGGWDEIADYRFGAVSDGDYWVTPEMVGQNIDIEAGGDALRVRANGEITVKVDLKMMTVAIEGEVLPEPTPDPSDKVYIMGDPAGGWKTNLGLEMQYDETNKVYTATISGDGDMYFGFTTKLAETEDAWDDIVAYRFGAVSEGDFVVTNSNKGEIALASNADGGQTLLIQGGGEFKLILDKENMKLTIEGEIKEVVAEAEFYYIGTANNWSTSNLDYPFEPQGNGVHKIVITNPAAAEWFAIAPKAAYGASNFWGQVLRPSTGNGTGAGTVSYATGDSYGSWCVNNATSITVTLDTTKGTVTVE